MMKVTGFTFIRNAVINDYPIVESIKSILPICDEFIIAYGNSSDETLLLLKGIDSPKIKIIDTIWDENQREGGRTFALETDKAFKAISKDTDWAFYIQGDEVVHEKYLPTIRKEMELCLANKDIEGLLFKYIHFYGSYDYYAVSRRWYRREIRIVRNLKEISSYRDAQGFRLNNRKIKVKEIDAYIYHYGWVKPPHELNSKVRNFNKFYHEDEWIETNVPKAQNFDYGNADELRKFTLAHPTTIQQRIINTNWEFLVDPTSVKKKLSLRRRILKKIEDKTGIRLFEYKNYNKIN
ncbi:glycosyltransferase family protein [Pedobacter arcticus]|uniref:glycosyltransferase family 2 protein n=1 Tax=Pedobacter arcticus TaxID=752140 RepID=UPI0002F7BC64|nr:glycosyltransferase family 2 protein [Pedobacter arcticus]